MARNLAEQVEAVRVGQHQVEDDKIGPKAPERGQAGRPIRRMLNLELVLAEIIRHHPGKADIVFDQENKGHGT